MSIHRRGAWPLFNLEETREAEEEGLTLDSGWLELSMCVRSMDLGMPMWWFRPYSTGSSNLMSYRSSWVVFFPLPLSVWSSTLCIGRSFLTSVNAWWFTTDALLDGSCTLACSGLLPYEICQVGVLWNVTLLLWTIHPSSVKSQYIVCLSYPNNLQRMALVSILIRLPASFFLAMAVHLIIRRWDRLGLSPYYPS